MPTHGRIINHFRNTDELPKDQVLPHMVQHERSRVASICLSQGWFYTCGKAVGLSSFVYT